MPEHQHRLVVLFADQTIVLLVKVVTVVLHIFERVGLLAVVELVPYVVVQLGSILLFILITHLFEFLFSETSVLTFVHYLLFIKFLAYLSKQFHQPFG